MLPTLLIACALWIAAVVPVAVILFLSSKKPSDRFDILLALAPVSWVLQPACQFTKNYKLGIPMHQPPARLHRPRKIRS
jgi:hypothetical protein